MDSFSRDDLRNLIEAPRGRCVSIFMPTHRLGPERQQDPIRLKNLLKDAEEQLSEQGHRDLETSAMLDPAWQLVEDMTFWQHQSDGLAIFIAPAFFRHFRVPLDLPQRAVVAERFHVKPLLPMLTGDGRFYILALSQGHISLFRASRDGVAEVDLEGMPRNLGEALQYDEYGENQYYTNTSASITAGRGAARYAGSGMSLDENKDNILRYFQRIDHGLQRYLRNEQAPLVLAGVEYLLPVYHEANTYPYLVDEAITGNPDDLRAEDLHERAWNIVRPIFTNERKEAVDRYRRYRGANPGLISNAIREVVSAAYYGRIDTLFVDTHAQQWGWFDSQNNIIHIHEGQEQGDEDVLDFAAIHTLLNSGQVYDLDRSELSEDSPLAAILRY